MRRRRRIAGACSALVGAAVLALLWASDVDTSLTEEDRRAIATLGVDTTCDAADTLDGQIRCLQALQAALREAAPDISCVDEYGVTSHEPSAFLERQHGCCYDRSRLLEKSATFYGMRVRHIALYHTQSAIDLLRSGTPSHSLLEVETEAGWMVVDSNQATLGLTRDEQPLDAVELGSELRDGGTRLADQNYREFFDGNYTVLYGVYSRHGGFYPPFVHVPDVDWSQLHYNLDR